jgi:uncharacterized protein YjbJ (UPF0337 family)
MAQRVTAIFTNREDAERTADALVALGADRSHISTVVRHEDRPVDTATARPHSEHLIEPAREVGDAGAPLTTTDEPDAARGAAAGAVIGAVAGILAGAAMLAVPGFGLVLAAGPLSWAIGGAVGATVGGAVAGGVYGSLRDIGISEPHARAYEERIRGGDVLMTALLPNLDEPRVRSVLAEHHAEDVTFVDDTSTLATNFPAGEAAMAQSAAQPAYAQDRTLMTAPPNERMMDTSSTAPASVSATYVESTTVVGHSPNIARGEAKQVEGEQRDRAADRILNPSDDMAAKGEKAAGKLQEEYGEEEETVDQRA